MWSQFTFPLILNMPLVLASMYIFDDATFVHEDCTPYALSVSGEIWQHHLSRNVLICKPPTSMPSLTFSLIDGSHPLPPFLIMVPLPPISGWQDFSLCFISSPPPNHSSVLLYYFLPPLLSLFTIFTSIPL